MSLQGQYTTELSWVEMRCDQFGKEMSVCFRKLYEAYPHGKDNTLVINGIEIRLDHFAGNLYSLLIRGAKVR